MNPFTFALVSCWLILVAVELLLAWKCLRFWKRNRWLAAIALIVTPLQLYAYYASEGNPLWEWVPSPIPLNDLPFLELLTLIGKRSYWIFVLSIISVGLMVTLTLVGLWTLPNDIQTPSRRHHSEDPQRSLPSR